MSEGNSSNSLIISADKLFEEIKIKNDDHMELPIFVQAQSINQHQQQQEPQTPDIDGFLKRIEQPLNYQNSNLNEIKNGNKLIDPSLEKLVNGLPLLEEELRKQKMNNESPKMFTKPEIKFEQVPKNAQIKQTAEYYKKLINNKKASPVINKTKQNGFHETPPSSNYVYESNNGK